MIQLGRIVGVFGVRGWVKLESWTDPREAIFDYPLRVVSVGQSPVDIEPSRLDGRVQGKGLVAELPGVDTPELAQRHIGSKLYVDRNDMPPARPGEYYWADLEGLDVCTVEDVKLGRVSHLISTGANDVLVVQGDRERLIPFVQPDVIRSVDLAARRIEVDWDPDF